MINTIGKTSGLEVQPTASARPSVTQLTSLDTTRMRFSFGRLLLAELRLLRKGLRRWWLLVAAVLILAGALAPIDVARQYLLPFTWLWPLLIWSALGTRETRHNTTGLVFSAANPLSRQLPATWLTGVLVTALAGSPWRSIYYEAATRPAWLPGLPRCSSFPRLH